MTTFTDNVKKIAQFQAFLVLYVAICFVLGLWSMWINKLVYNTPFIINEHNVITGWISVLLQQMIVVSLLCLIAVPVYCGYKTPDKICKLFCLVLSICFLGCLYAGIYGMEVYLNHDDTTVPDFYTESLPYVSAGFLRALPVVLITFTDFWQKYSINREVSPYQQQPQPKTQPHSQTQLKKISV